MVKLLAADGACDECINLIRSLRLVNHSVDDPIQAFDPFSQLCTPQHQLTNKRLRDTEQQLIVRSFIDCANKQGRINHREPILT